MLRQSVSALFALIAVLGIGLACGLDADEGQSSESTSLPRKLDSYEIKGISFVYYLIPTGLSEEELLRTAEEIHASEPDAQLILVDDDSKVGEYIAYVKAISGPGDVDVTLPQEWADKHIVANVQKHLNGRWVLYKSYGYEEIGELKSE